MRREPLGDRLERRKPAPNLAHVPSHTLRVPVLDRCEIQPHPSSNVKTRTPSVPHITFGACVTIVPACTARCPGGRGAGRAGLCARITRSTRVRATRIPSKIRSRAWTFRWPSPWNGERSRSA